jgi:hypothetical protein
MKKTIVVQSYDDSEEDCKRETYYTVVDGKEYLLAPCSLGSYYTYLEILAEIDKLFGKDVDIVWDCGYLRMEPY